MNQTLTKTFCISALFLAACQSSAPTSDKSVSAVSAAVTAAPPAAPAMPFPEPTEQDEADWLSARAKVFDAAMANEGRENDWAADIETRTKARYATPSPVHLVSSSCAKTICRLAFDYDSLGDRYKHLATFHKDYMDLPQASFYYPGAPSDPTHVVIYLAKRGTTLPRYSYADHRVAAASHTL